MAASELGLLAGDITLNYLQGRLQLPHHVTTFDVPNLPQFDWQVLRRWGANVRKLPEHTIFLNRPPSMWDEHRAALILGTGSSTALVLLAAALMVVNRRQNAALGRLKETEESLRDSEEHHRRLFETMAQGVIYQDTDGAIISANPAAERILGLTADQMRGKTSMDPRWKMITPDYDDVPGTEHPAMIALRTGETVGPVVRGVFRPERNSYTWLSITAIPLFQLGKRVPFQAYATFEDITERRQAQEELRKSLERLQKVLEVETVGVMFWDLARGVMTDANDTFLTMTGYTRKEMEEGALTWRKLTPPEFHEVSLAEVRKLQETGRVGPYEKEYLHKDGTRQWMVFAGSSLDENTCVEFCVDISDRKKAEASLLETNKRLAAFLQVSQAVSSSFERHVVMQSLVNNAVQAMNLASGAIYLREGDFIRVTAATPAPPMDLPEQFRRSSLHDHPHIAQTLNTDSPVIISDSAMTNLSPEERTVVELLNLHSILYLPIHLGSQAIGVLILSDTKPRTFHPEEVALLQGFADQASQVMDNIRLFEEVQNHAVQLEHEIGQRKEVEEVLRMLNQDLEERVQQRTLELKDANKQLEAFSYSVSHDLRAPLRGVTGLASILLNKHSAALSEDGKKLCAMINHSARTMGLLIDDLLAFSLAGRKALHVSSIDMTAMVHEVIAELAETGDWARVDFQVGDLPPAVADPSLIRQVWVNLLANAAKFSSMREQPAVRISAQRQEDGDVVYQVQDNGAGFDMQFAHKLFNVFQRLHSARDFEGTGVGLAIVRQIVIRHGGRVWGQGEPGKGATFCFTLGDGQDE